MRYSLLLASSTAICFFTVRAPGMSLASWVTGFSAAVLRGLSTQRSHVFVCLDLGMTDTDRVMVQRHPDEAGNGRSIYDRQWIQYAHCTPFLLLLWLRSWLI